MTAVDGLRIDGDQLSKAAFTRAVREVSHDGTPDTPQWLIRRRKKDLRDWIAEEQVLTTARVKSIDIVDRRIIDVKLEVLRNKIRNLVAVIPEDVTGDFLFSPRLVLIPN